MRVNNEYYRSLNDNLKKNIHHSVIWLNSGEAIKFFMQRHDRLQKFLKESELYQSFRNNTKACYSNARELIEDFYLKGEQAGYREIREDRVFTLRDRKTIDHLKDYNYSLIKDINNDHARIISDTLINGVIEGKNPRVIAKELNSTTSLPGKRGLSPRARANMIARTETSRALNKGTLGAYKNYGIKEVIWVTARDGRVCVNCAFREAKTFPINKVEIPLHPNCRCTVRAKINKKNTRRKKS